VGSPAGPLRGLLAQAATRQGLHRLGQMPGLARIARRIRTPKHTPLQRLPVSLLFSPNSFQCRLQARCLTTTRSAQISRHRGNPPRRCHRPRSAQPQPQLRPRRDRSDPPLTAKSTWKEVRTQRRLGGQPRAELMQRLCEATINTCRWMKELVQAAK